MSAALGAIATAGLVFAYTGFRNIIELSGEAKNPRRDIPRALIVTIIFTIVLYLGLQSAFLGALPGSELVHGWHGVNLNSPFADLAMLVGFPWLSWLLVADSVVSPSGSGIVYTAANSRNVYGLAKNRFFPHWFAHINSHGVPGRALLINLVVGIAFLLPLPSWHDIVGVMSTIAVFTFSIGSVSLLTFRRMRIGSAEDRLPGMRIVAPAAFVVSSLVVLWTPWSKLILTLPIVAVGLVVYVITYVLHRHPRHEVMGGLWLVAYLAFVYLVSGVSSFGGAGLIPAPWDNVVVVVASLAFYFWGVRAGTAFMSASPELVDELRTGEIRSIEQKVQQGTV